MTARPIVFALISTLTPIAGAAVEDRLDRLENQVSEIQLLLSQLNKHTKAHFDQPHFSPNQPTRNNGGEGYRIKPRDSYWSIARRHHVSVLALERANPGINPRKLQIGRTINIPGQMTVSSPKSTTNGNHTGTYRVKKGDILGRISEAHGIRLHQLLSANPGLNPRKLPVGKVLRIPGQPLPKKATSERIPPRSKPANPPKPKPEKPSIPLVESRPFIESTKPDIKQASVPEIAPLLPDQPKLITVSKNTRLSQIAVSYKTTVAEINQLNRLEFDGEQMIKTGSQLYVPKR